MDPQGNRKFTVRNILIFNVILLAFLLSFHGLYTAYTNTIWRNARWESSKVKLEKGLMGAWSFVLTYRALAHHRLDLGTWHGYQEVFLKDTLAYDRLTLRFRLEDSAFLVVYYAGLDDELYALRLSAHPAHAPAWLGLRSMEFTDKDLIRHWQVPEVWHELRLEREARETRAFLDGTLLAVHRENGPAVPLLGLRGSGRRTEVDDVRLFQGTDQQVFGEDFSKKYHHYLIYLAFLVLSNAAFLLLYGQRRWLLPLSVNITVLTAALSLFFLTVGIERYPPRWMVKWGQRVSTIEEGREVSQRIRQQYAPADGDSTLRVLFIGSSQTWGAGASADSLTLASRFARMLSDSLGGRAVEAINAGISGMNSDVLLEMYRDDWAGLRPRYVVINLGFNDSGNPRFGHNLNAMVRLARERGGTPFLLAEPVNEIRSFHLDNLNIMRVTASSARVPLVDMHRILPAFEDSGFLYWDFIHLTDYGQERFARALVSAMLPRVRSDEAQKHGAEEAQGEREKP
ncbi:MAG TPA: SGNH/GDSL hydrolase family protein [Bacteroidales bacterium]|nr:SGNH/GDSL hydrolase family protein [Bacteroidales bacterium]HRZ76462.1 SGNH/GDSL hydrolase family protein [Bacteroidales bacterium]